MFNLLRKQFKLIETLPLGPYESCGSVVFFPLLDSCPAPPFTPGNVAPQQPSRMGCYKQRLPSDRAVCGMDGDVRELINISQHSLQSTFVLGSVFCLFICFKQKMIN